MEQLYNKFKQKLNQNPKAVLYKVLASEPILSEQDKYVINEVKISWRFC